MEEVEEAAGGDTHCLVLKKDGSLWGWGHNVHGQVGVPDSEWNTPQQIQKFWPDSEKILGIGCGGYFSWAFTCSGDLYTWGKWEGGGTTHIFRPTKKNIRVSLPCPRRQENWEKIFQWFFLGVSDVHSRFWGLPLEVLYGAVSVVNRSALRSR
jgi:alpha-tubulin suppressor-like RCC1 family protein